LLVGSEDDLARIDSQRDLLGQQREGQRPGGRAV